MHLPDRTGPWTLDAVLALDEDTSHRVEMVGGALLLTPRPGLVHQRAVHRLALALEAAATGYEVLTAVNVHLPGRALVVPDIVVLQPAAAAGADRFADADAVLMAVEVTDASSTVTDRITKPVLYAEAGIAHLWRLDLEPAPELHTAALRGGVYAPGAHLCPGRTGTVAAPFPLRIDPADLTASRRR
ncbi:Uma2 family endonuclease [Streptomyces sp. NPDC013489]|uniref:Uma2 family endonuclease n=1 Tax=Streptomyces sp. NPDC013489 TaxID=3155606 RepID=UPI0033F9F1F0